MSLWSAITEFLTNIPPWGIINPDEGGVFLRGGLYRRTLGAGFYWKWPVYDEIQSINIKEQVINLPNQSIDTKDGKSLAISGAIHYEISDAKKTILDVQDWDTSLQNLAMGTICSFVSNSNYVDCTYLNIVDEVYSELEQIDWGVEIIAVWLTDKVNHRAIRLMTKDTPID